MQLATFVFRKLAAAHELMLLTEGQHALKGQSADHSALPYKVYQSCECQVYFDWCCWAFQIYFLADT